MAFSGVDERRFTGGVGDGEVEQVGVVIDEHRLNRLGS